MPLRPHLLHSLCCLAGCVLSLGACSKGDSTSPDERPFQLARELLDVDASLVPSQIERCYPNHARVPGALQRFEINDAPGLAEVIVFTDVRSGRISSVVLKFHPGIDDGMKRRLLAAAGAPDLVPEGLPATLDTKTSEGRKLRIIRSDKRGQLSITME